MSSVIVAFSLIALYNGLELFVSTIKKLAMLILDIKGAMPISLLFTQSN